MPKIEVMYAFVAVEKEPDDEGVAAVRFGDVWMPLVGADMARVEALKPLAQKLVNLTGKKITIIKFTNRETIETFTPPKKKEG